MTPADKIKLLATEVMGWEKVPKPDGLIGIDKFWIGEGGELYYIMDQGGWWHEWNPLDNIAHAWQIVEKMRERDYSVEIDMDRLEVDMLIIQMANCGRGVAPTAPRAICEAALATIG